MVGIYGLSGIGKTIIAQALYDEIACQFEAASFLVNIGEVSKKDSLYCIQKRLLCDILLEGENQEISFRRRNNLLKDKIRCKKVLIVLDDVNDLEQLHILAGNHDWFGKGSRIVITTRNKHLLYQHRVDEFYEPTPLDPREALEFFSHHANTKKESLYDFYALSKQVISYCDHHPLALQVVGSFLRGKSYLQWQVQLENLARESAGENLNIFRVSYDGQGDQEQCMFLDVACFFKGEYKDFVTKMLDGHDFSAENGVQVLTDRGLITISERKLWMQSILQKLGWQLAQKDRERCRLWDHMDIQRSLRTKKGKDAVEGISLDLFKSNQIKFPTEVFARMTEIKLLKIFLGSDCVRKENFSVNLSPDFSLPSHVLRYLYWHGYQLKLFPSAFEARELFELHMPYSCLKVIEGNQIHFPKLTILDLSHSQSLEDISNFSRMPNLERLVLDGCRRLVKVDQSIGDLKKLSLINLKDCRSLTSLPESISKLKFLETLILVGCLRLEKLPDDLMEQQSLVNMEANGTPIRIPVLPSRIQQLDAYNCISMETLSSNTKLAASILSRIQDPRSEFSALVPGNRILDRCFYHKAKGSSVTIERLNPNWYNNDFLGFAVCLVLAPKAEKSHLHPEILCELNNFTFFYSCGEDCVDEVAESGQECGNRADHVWVACRPRAQAYGCRPKEWNRIKASFEVFACEVKRVCYSPNIQVVFDQ